MNKKGNEAEKKAKSFLINNNFKIIETNFFAKKLGEIDIIAKKDNILHFCEVKSGKSYESAINNISPKKLEKIKNSSLFYLQKESLDVDFSIDAILVVEEKITFIENITF